MGSTVIGGSAVSVTTGSGLYTPINTYTTVRKLRNYLSLASYQVADDNTLKDFIKIASRAIDGYTRRKFYPHRHTGTSARKFNLPDNRTILRMNHDILEVRGLSDVNGSSEIDSGVYWLRCGRDWNRTPYDRIEINRSSGSTFNYSATHQQAVHVDTIEGFHSDYPDGAWIDSGASTISSMTNSQTMASISGSMGINLFGDAPRFEEMQLWKIENEFIATVTRDSNSGIRVIRGINGTSAVAHPASTQVYVWQPETDIEFSATRLAGMQYHQKERPFTNKVSSIQFGIIEDESTWPSDVMDKLKRYKRTRFGAI